VLPPMRNSCLLEAPERVEHAQLCCGAGSSRTRGTRPVVSRRFPRPCALDGTTYSGDLGAYRRFPRRVAWLPARGRAVYQRREWCYGGPKIYSAPPCKSVSVAARIWIRMRVCWDFQDLLGIRFILLLVEIC
jgi:hypothetical protein